MSTTLNQDIAKTFQNVDKGDSLIAIDVPRGTPALVINSALPKDNNNYPHEHEVLLGKNLNFEVKGTTTVNQGDRSYKMISLKVVK
jgi:hypothetical protein